MTAVDPAPPSSGSRFPIAPRLAPRSLDARGMSIDARNVARFLLPALLVGCAAELEPADDVGAASESVIFGTDDRREVHQVSSALQQVANSVAVVLEARHVSRAPGGRRIITHDRLRLNEPVCASEPFANQPNPGMCTAFVVGRDRIATAGHCASEHACAGQRFFVFGFQMEADGRPRLSVGADDVYECRSIVARGYSYLNTGVPRDYEDWVVVQVDRPIEGHPPLRLRRAGVVANGAPLVIVGHPFGLPLKVASGGQVRDNTRALLFGADLDSYPGNSGSPVIHATTLEVEGILIQGQDDLERMTGGGRTCVRSRVCDAAAGCPEPYNRPFPYQGVGRIAQILGAVDGPRAACASDDPLASNVRAGSIGVTAQGCGAPDAQGRRNVQQCLCVPDGASTASWLCDAAPRCRPLGDFGEPPPSAPAGASGCGVATSPTADLALVLLVLGAVLAASRRRR